MSNKRKRSIESKDESTNSKKKVQPERIQKIQAELKKAETERKKAEAKKTQAERKKAHAELKKTRAEQKKAEKAERKKAQVTERRKFAKEKVLMAKSNAIRKSYFDELNALVENVPNFWKKVICNHYNLWLMEDRDEGYFQYLKKFEVQNFDDVKTGYCFKFTFAKNPFFKDEVLVKNMHVEANPKGRWNRKRHSTSTKIEWKKGKEYMGEPKWEEMWEQYEMNFFYWFQDTSNFEHSDSSFDSIEEGSDLSIEEITQAFKNDIASNAMEIYFNHD